MLLFTVLIACGNPIDKCGSLAVDCCEADEHCADYYGPAFPYCYNPGPQGVCGACLTSADCNGSACIADDEIGAFCEAP